MSGDPNPFRFNRPTHPDELVGRRPLVEHLVAELHAWSGDSYAVIGGRRFGKSSLLLAVEHAIEALGRERGDGELRVLPVRFSLQDVLPLDSPERFFRAAIDETHRALAAIGPSPGSAGGQEGRAPPSAPTLQGFEETVRWIAGARPGPLRIALLLDEMDSALESAAVGALFGNLRSLISTGRVSDKVRIVAAGAGRFRELDGKDSPLFNVLTPISLEALDEAASRILIARARGLDAAVADASSAAAGGHPFILQFLLHHLHRAGAASAVVADLAAAEHRFLQERGPDLEAWWRAVGPEGQAVYGVLSRTGEWMSAGAIGRALAERPGGVQRGVEALCSHGLVVPRHDHREHRVGGELFRAWHRAAEPTPAPITAGMVLHHRYEIRDALGKGGIGEVFLAFDRATQEEVALKIVRPDLRLPGDDEALRKEVLLARSVSHPNVCRVHDLTPSDWGPILVMEHIPGRTLYKHIRDRQKQGGYTADEFRRIASAVCQGLAAIHAQGLVHGDVKPGNVMVDAQRSVILGFARERARASSRRPGAPPDGGTPNYMSPERLHSGGASAEDDVYGIALTLWEMWTCQVPEPRHNPRERTMRSQIRFDVPGELSITEVKQIFRGMNEDPQMRPRARQMRFFTSAHPAAGSTEPPRVRLDPGPPLGPGASASFSPDAQALLVTYATHAPEAVGTLLPLGQPLLTLGRRDDQDLVIPEGTVSSAHAQLRWQQGSWILEDLESENGSYADPGYERATPITLVHGGEVQLGECRLKLVSFAADSPLHKHARRHLARRDGLCGLLERGHLMKALDEDGQFSAWYEAPLHLCRYDLRGPSRRSSARSGIRELLALRQAARRVVEVTEMRLPSLAPVVAGRTGPLRFVVSMVGPTLDEAHHVVAQVVSQVQGLLPDGIELSPTLLAGQPGRPARRLID